MTNSFCNSWLVLQFLAEMLHPLVRPDDEEEVGSLLNSFNEALARDGYELYPADWISGHAVYGWRRRDSFHGASPDLRLGERELLTDPVVLEEHLVRIRDSLSSDPAAAISSSKNLVESLFRIILDHSGVAYGQREDIPQLYRYVADLLELKADSHYRLIALRHRGSETRGVRQEMRHRDLAQCNLSVGRVWLSHFSTNETEFRPCINAGHYQPDRTANQC
jgi:hypothetical protein